LEGSRLKPAELSLAATHTHTAPTPALDPARGHTNNLEYTRSLRGQLVHLAQEALAHLVPGNIGRGAEASPVRSNRRQTVTDTNGRPRVELGRNPSAATHREVQVLRMQRATVASVAAVFFA